METLSVVQSLLIALWVAAVMSRWLGGGATLTLRFSPLMTGLVVGLIMGEVAQAMIVTGSVARSSDCRCGASRIARKLLVSVSFFHQYFFR